MTIALPTSPNYRASNFRLISNAARFVSPLTRVGQSVMRPGDFWACEMELPPIVDADVAGEWAATLALLVGGRNSAYIKPPYRNSITSPIGTPLVNGGGQSGTSINIDGFTAGRVIPKGSFLSYSTPAGARMLHIVTAQATANGSGQAALSVLPPLRDSPADNAAVDFSSPSCAMVLVDPEQDVLSLSDSMVYGVTLRMVEDVR